MCIKKNLVVPLTVVALLGISGTTDAAKKRFISIGTGAVDGVYYPIGISICNLVNKRRKIHGVRCSVEATNGSVYNINTVRAEEIEFGVVQSDSQYRAYQGLSSFKSVGPFKGLRSVFSVHPKLVTIVARKDLGARHIDQLRDPSLNLSDLGLSIDATWEGLASVLGWGDNINLKTTTVTNLDEHARMLCNSEIDAFYWLVGHPSLQMREATAACETTIVNVTGPTIDRLLAIKPFYRYAKIFGGMYRGNPNNISTFGVGATLVTSTRLPTEVVYIVVKSVFSNFDSFKNQHPALAVLKKKEMIKDSLTAPLHDGAIAYYKEANLM